MTMDTDQPPPPTRFEDDFFILLTTWSFMSIETFTGFNKEYQVTYGDHLISPLGRGLDTTAWFTGVFETVRTRKRSILSGFDAFEIVFTKDIEAAFACYQSPNMEIVWTEEAKALREEISLRSIAGDPSALPSRKKTQRTL